jgi:PHD/YefM family antitoxin component YafN of YafNO toxin-antitoxin module
MLFHDSTNLTDFRDHLASHLKRLQTSKKPMAVTQRGKIKGIMLSPRQYEALAEAEGLQRLMQSLDEARQGKTVDAFTFIKRLKRKYQGMAAPESPAQRSRESAGTSRRKPRKAL